MNKFKYLHYFNLLLMVSFFIVFIVFVTFFSIYNSKLQFNKKNLDSIDTAYALEINNIVAKHSTNLLFSEFDGNTQSPIVPPFITGDDIINISVVNEGVQFEFTEKAAKIFNAVANRLLHSSNSKICIYIIFDNTFNIIAAPDVNAPLKGNKIVLSNVGNENEYKELAQHLINYCLPVKLNILNAKTENLKAPFAIKYLTQDYLVLFISSLILFLVAVAIEGAIIVKKKSPIPNFFRKIPKQ